MRYIVRHFAPASKLGEGTRLLEAGERRERVRDEGTSSMDHSKPLQLTLLGLPLLSYAPVCRSVLL